MKVFAIFAFMVLGLYDAQAQNEVGNKQLVQKLTRQPKFPGGEAALIAFLKNNMQYPQLDRQNNIQGKVLLQFMVDVDGSVKNINILRGLSPATDAEAIRVVKMLPQWQPAKYYNKPVPVYMRIPVLFSLN